MAGGGYRIWTFCKLVLKVMVAVACGGGGRGGGGAEVAVVGGGRCVLCGWSKVIRLAAGA